MKCREFILRDQADDYWDDLVVFEDSVEIDDVKGIVKELKRKEHEENYDYTNEDVYEELKKLGSYKLYWLGDLDIIEY